jgi:uncharacterized membrane protein
MTDESVGEPGPSAWMNLGPVDQARQWEDFRPGTFEQMFALVVQDAEYKRARAEQQARHERRLDYIAVALQIARLIFGLAAVFIISLTAKYYAEHNAASEGAKVFGLGAGSIVAAFIGTSFSPMLKRLSRRRADKDIH